MLDSWRAWALDPPRASGAPLGAATIRAVPEDFVVEEELGFAPSGAGQHVLLKVRKRDANTQWVARALAGKCGCRPMDVGYAGLKDRHAVAVQWFTVPRSAVSIESWLQVNEPDFAVLEAHEHSRKLPRGALAANSFAIRIRGPGLDDLPVRERLALLEQRGVPNFFGPQRFGRCGSNLEAIATGRPLQPRDRGFVLSAARSLIFNAVLTERVADASWASVEAGDLANLDGRGSFFAVDTVDATLQERCARLDIHPTGPLWGRGAPAATARVLQLETRIGTELSAAALLTQEAGMEQERRSLRLAVRDVAWTCESDTSALIRFRLGRGSFATTVLRELFELDAADEAAG